MASPTPHKFVRAPVLAVALRSSVVLRGSMAVVDVEIETRPTASARVKCGCGCGGGCTRASSAVAPVRVFQRAAVVVVFLAKKIIARSGVTREQTPFAVCSCGGCGLLKVSSCQV